MHRFEWYTQPLFQRILQLRAAQGGFPRPLVISSHGCKFCKGEEQGSLSASYSTCSTHISGGPSANPDGRRPYSTRATSTTDYFGGVDPHEEFLSNCNDHDADEAAVGGSHSASVRSARAPRSPGAKERFRQAGLPEGDMYSVKPVWQQLNEVESTWNMHFRRKGRVESQRAIAKAKKCVESLDSIEANEARLVNIGSFRAATGGGGPHGSPAALSGPSDATPSSAPAGTPPRPTTATCGDGYKNASLRIPKNHAAAPSTGGGRWMDKGAKAAPVPEGGYLVNDLHLPGDAYYQAVSLDAPDATPTVAESDLNLSPEEAALRASVAPSVLVGRLLNDSERSAVETIFGRQAGDVVDAATPAAVIAAETKLEPETWLNMNPAHIVLQQAILKCKSSSQVLLAIGDKAEQLNAVNAATALHRLARHTTSYSRYALTGNDTFCRLLAAVERQLLELDCQGLTNVLWSLVRLGAQPRWLDALLAALHQHAAELTPSELASALFAVSKLPVKGPVGVDLRDRMIGLAQERVAHFKRPLDLTCLATALARLNVRNPVLFGAVSSAVLAAMPEFTLQQLCGVAWSFASLGFTDRALFARIRQFLEEHASASNMHDVVHLAWALSKVREADRELFVCTISPLVRSHVSHLRCRDITTVAWAYVNADIEDADLFEDLAAALEHHVDEMGTHDVAAAVVAFSRLEESHRPLFKKMRNRALLLANEFTPLQLAKIVRGFSSVADARFYTQVCRAIEAKAHLMLPENVVEVLMGLTEVGHAPPSLLKQLVAVVSSGTRKMYAEDCLLLLQVALRLRRGCEDPALASALHRLCSSLVEQIEKRVGRWRCNDISHVTLLFECLRDMGIGGPAGDHCVRDLSRRLSSCLNRLCAMKAPSLERNEAFAAFIAACAQLPPRKLSLVQAELSKSAELMTSMHNCVAALRSGAFLEGGSTGLSQIDVAYYLVRIGYLDEGVVALCDAIATSDSAAPDLADDRALDQLSKAVWLLTESNLHVPWVREALRAVGDSAPPSTATESLLRLLWSCVVLGEDALLMPLLQRFVPLFGRLPEDMLSAQQVALHVLRCLPVRLGGSDESGTFAPSEDAALTAGGLESYELPEDLHGTLAEWLEYQRDDLYTASPGSRKKRALELDYDSALSESLIAMKIPHKTVHTVENVYRVSVSFPVENHVLDVLNFTDCFVPHCQPRSSALLRQRQLQLLGYGVASLRLGQIYAASREGSCKQLVAEAVGGFNAAAMDYLPAPSD